MLDDNELLFDELYEKTKDCGRVQFINLLMEKEREKQELKKELEDEQNYSQSVFSDFQDYKEEASAYLDKIENQQKEFINYLESESKELIRDAGYHQRICLEILEKYKGIIGVKDE